MCLDRGSLKRVHTGIWQERLELGRNAMDKKELGVGE